MNVGSEREVSTEIHFGQDILVQDQLEREQRRSERLEQHFPSEITVRGVIYPGVVLKSHGRQREVRTALREVVFFFNTTTGRIEEKPLNE
jgi:hypothetical protein